MSKKKEEEIEPSDKVKVQNFGSRTVWVKGHYIMPGQIVEMERHLLSGTKGMTIRIIKEV